MGAIATQGLVGPVGAKATTELSYNFNSMANTGKFQFGANGNGLYRLNTGELDDAAIYERTFVINTSDYGVKNPKQFRFIYIGFSGDQPFTVSVDVDEQGWRDYTVIPKKTGLQRIRVPIGSNQQGRYWRIKITSNYRYRIDQVDGEFYIRSSGIGGY